MSKLFLLLSVSCFTSMVSAQTRVGSGVDSSPLQLDLVAPGIDLRSTDSLNVIQPHRRLEWKDVVHPPTRGTLCRIPKRGEPQYARPRCHSAWNKMVHWPPKLAASFGHFNQHASKWVDEGTRCWRFLEC